MQIITNNKPRQMIYGYQLTEKQKADFDYVADIDSADFVAYRGNIYYIGDFMRCPDSADFKGWSGYACDSYFSGVLIKLIDNDSVLMARYFS